MVLENVTLDELKKKPNTIRLQFRNEEKLKKT